MGIDPGASGGFALIDGAGGIISVVQPSDEAETCVLLRRLAPGAVVAMEKVGGYIKGAMLPGSAMFRFGRSTGVVAGCLLTLGVQFEEVPPQAWQACHGLVRQRGVAKPAWKRQLQQRAQELFNDHKVTLWAADALLIARWAMLQSTVAAKSIGMPAASLDDPWFG